MSFGIIVKRYEHFNRTMNKHIRSKKHYEEEMAKGGWVDWETGERLAEDWRKAHHKEYDGISKEAREVIESARQSADSKGNIKPGDRLIDGMKKVGVKFNFYNQVPKVYQQQGGFIDEKKSNG